VSVRLVERPRQLAELLVMLVLSAALLGGEGICAILFFHWISGLRLGVDEKNKHGLSVSASSRLGGLAVFMVAIVLIVCGALIDPQRMAADISRTGTYHLWFISLIVCALMGLSEDLRNNFLTPRVRLISKFAVIAAMAFYWPQIIPTSIGVYGVDFLLQSPLIGLILVTIFLVGFINAINMADGANGLVPGVVVCATLIFSLQTNRMVDESIFLAFAAFLLFNVISGRLFLGDMGTYGAGCMLGLYGLIFFNEGVFSLSFLAALFAYPCLDFLVSISRRLAAGESAFLPDNNHLHNRLYFHVAKRLGDGVHANSVTGLLIASCTSGVVLLGYLQNWWPVTSNSWIVIFIGEILAYALVLHLCDRAQVVSQHSKTV